MVAIWEQRGADFSSFNLVTLGWVCPHLVAWSSNGCNTLEDLITTQAALRDTLGMLKPLSLLIAAISSPLSRSLSFVSTWKEFGEEQSWKDTQRCVAHFNWDYFLARVLDRGIEWEISLGIFLQRCQITYVLKYVVSLLISSWSSAQMGYWTIQPESAQTALPLTFCLSAPRGAPDFHITEGNESYHGYMTSRCPGIASVWCRCLWAWTLGLRFPVMTLHQAYRREQLMNNLSWAWIKWGDKR